MDKIYFGNFTRSNDIVSGFEISDEELRNAQVIFAAYDCASYEGDAHVIFVRDGKIYEVNGSHCSCYGLEERWRPEETSAIALLSRPNVSDDAKANIRKFYKNFMCFL